MSVGSLFNQEWYLKNYPDVAEAVNQGLVTAWDHFHYFGRGEGRSPSPLFDPEYYLAQNPDVRTAVEAGIGTAYDHFIQFGIGEARSFVPFFDPSFYLRQNPDINNAVDGDLGSAVMHFLLHGQGEPRSISPFLNLATYLEANPDVASAIQQFDASALEHLLMHGVNEGRPLGNGISLAQFASDPVFQNASSPFEALSRVAEVAPFLPSFEPPAGWEPPANTPIPVDFVPVEGEKLVIPPSVQVPDDVELPEDVFEPVTPPGPQPEPEPVDPGGPGQTVPFRLILKDGELSFGGTAQGDITVSVENGTATFTRDGNSLQIQDFEQKVSSVVVKNGALIREGDFNIDGLTLDVRNADISLPEEKSENVLVYDDGFTGDKALKTLKIKASGDSSVYLGNPHGDNGIGYYLGEVTVEGGESGDSLYLGNLYFGGENTRFDSSEYKGDIYLNAYIYNGRDQLDHEGNEGYKWAINLGSGDDVLVVNGAWSGNYPGKYGSKIDGGGGDNTLVLLPNEIEGQPDVYAQWANPGTTWIPEDFMVGDQPIVAGFNRLVTNLANDREYESNLLGNQFNELVIFDQEQSASGAKITIGAGFEEVFIENAASVDASALKGNSATVNIVSGEADLHLTVANIDVDGKKSDLSGTRKSDMTIDIWDLADFEGGEVTIENLTISATSGYAHDPIKNDVILLGGITVDPEVGLAGNVRSFTVQKGEDRPNDDWYVDFVLEIDIDGEFVTTDDVVTFSLENVVSRGVYNNMLKALDTVTEKGLESTLGLVGETLIEGDLYSEFALAKGVAEVFQQFTWDSEPDALVGLVGILTNEGTLVPYV